MTKMHMLVSTLWKAKRLYTALRKRFRRDNRRRLYKWKRNEEIHARVEAGEAKSQVAADFGLSVTRVSDIHLNHGRKLRIDERHLRRLYGI